MWRWKLGFPVGFPEHHERGCITPMRGPQPVPRKCELRSGRGGPAWAALRPAALLGLRGGPAHPDPCRDTAGHGGFAWSCRALPRLALAPERGTCLKVTLVMGLWPPGTRCAGEQVAQPCGWLHRSPERATAPSLSLWLGAALMEAIPQPRVRPCCGCPGWPARPLRLSHRGHPHPRQHQGVAPMGGVAPMSAGSGTSRVPTEE